MSIKTLTAIKRINNEIADLCCKTEEPIFLTQNSKSNLVVMDIETYNYREKMLKLSVELLTVEEDRIAGRNGVTVYELNDYLKDIINKI